MRISWQAVDELNKLVCKLICLSGVCLALLQCDSPANPTTPTGQVVTPQTNSEISLTDAQAASVRQLTDEYLLQIDTDFTEAGIAIAAFRASIATFLDNPSTASLNTTKQSWIAAHSAYERTALHRYFIARVVGDNVGLQVNQLQYYLNQWPILPGYIDYVDAYPDSGIVNDMTVALTPENLREQHGLFDVGEAAIGFHVIEYLLWGVNPDESSPRPVSDYSVATTMTPAQAADGMTVDQLAPNRRRRLLDLAALTLEQDFQALVSLWTSNSATTRNSLMAMNAADLLATLMNAATDMLGEELLVRSLYPLLNGDYSDSIQSPFSHTTANAVTAQLSAMESLLLETYDSNGVTLDILLSDLSEDFSDFFYQNFDASKECLVLLYSSLAVPEDSPSTLRAQYDIVGCINLVTNMIGHLGQIVAVTQ